MEKTSSYYDWDQSFYKKPLDTITLFSSQCPTLFAKENLYKTASLLKQDFEFREVDFDNKRIKCKCITGDIEINSKKKFIKHRCSEFRNASKFYKHFCSHLIKMFILLFEMDLRGTRELLHAIQSTDYEFISK